MAGRKPILDNELPRFHAALAGFPLRDQALMLVAMHTGFRATELLSLDIGDVWEKGKTRSEVKLTRARMKGGRSRHRRVVTSRTVPLNAAATAIIAKYLTDRATTGPLDPAAPLFPSRFHGKRLTRWRANQIVHEVLTRAGIDDHGSHGTHSLRKTFCRHIYRATNNDLNLTRAIMGHTHVTTTQLYLHVEESAMQSAVLRIAQIGLNNESPAVTPGPEFVAA